MMDFDGDEDDANFFGGTESTEWLLRPILDTTAPLLLRANCMRSLAMLANDSEAHLAMLTKSSQTADISKAAMNIMELMESRLESLRIDPDKQVAVLAHRITNISRLHAMTLLTNTMPSPSKGRSKYRRQFGIRTRELDRPLLTPSLTPRQAKSETKEQAIISANDVAVFEKLLLAMQGNDPSEGGEDFMSESNATLLMQFCQTAWKTSAVADTSSVSRKIPRSAKSNNSEEDFFAMLESSSAKLGLESPSSLLTPLRRAPIPRSANIIPPPPPQSPLASMDTFGPKFSGSPGGLSHETTRLPTSPYLKRLRAVPAPKVRPPTSPPKSKPLLARSTGKMSPDKPPFNAWLDDTELKMNLSPSNEVDMYFMSPIRATDGVLIPSPALTKASSELIESLPREMSASTAVIETQLDLARADVAKASKMLARRMAEESLKLPASFIIEHGTRDMIKNIGVLAMRASIRHLSAKLWSRGFYRWFNYIEDLKFRDRRRHLLLGHMMKSLRAGHNRAQMIMLRQWLKIAKKIKRDENMRKRGVTKFLRFLVKGWRRLEIARKQHGFNKFRDNLIEFRRIQMQKRMSAVKIRKVLWQRLKHWKRKVLQTLRDADLGVYAVKIQRRYRVRLYHRHAMARVIQTQYRFYKDNERVALRRRNIYKVSGWHIDKVLPYHAHRMNVARKIQAAFRGYYKRKEKAARRILYRFWKPLLRWHNYRVAIGVICSTIRLIQRLYKTRYHIRTEKSKVLQAWYRSRLRSKTGVFCIIVDVAKRRLNATHIERVWRGHVGRKRAKRRQMYVSRQNNAALRLQRAWALRNDYFSTFVLETALRLSNRTDYLTWRKQRRDRRWRAVVAVQSMIRGLIWRKRMRVWKVRYKKRMKRKKLIDGAKTFLSGVNRCVVNTQRLWRGLKSRERTKEEMNMIAEKKSKETWAARIIQLKWMRLKRNYVLTHGFPFNPSHVWAACQYYSPDRSVRYEPLLTFKFRHRNLRRRVLIDAAMKGIRIPHARLIQRSWRGYIGRKIANVRRLRRDSSTQIQCAWRQMLARQKRALRIVEVRHAGAVYYMQLLPAIIAAKNVIIVTPAVRKIQGMYRAWKSREPIRHRKCAIQIQMFWRFHAARVELQRRYKGLERKNKNRFGHFNQMSLVMTSLLAQTEDIYDPYIESKNLTFDLWMTRLGLRHQVAAVKRRGVSTLKSLFLLLGIDGDDWRHKAATKTARDEDELKAAKQKIRIAQDQLEAVSTLQPEIPEKSSKLSKKERERQLKRAKAKVKGIKKRAADDLHYEQKAYNRLVSAIDAEEQKALKAIEKEMQIESAEERERILGMAWGRVSVKKYFRLVETKEACRDAVTAVFSDKKTGLSEKFANLFMAEPARPSYYQLQAFLTLKSKVPQEILKVGTKSMDVNDAQGKSELKADCAARKRVYLIYHAAGERIAALLAGRPYSSSLRDGRGHLHEMAVNAVLQAKSAAKQQGFGSGAIILRDAMEALKEQEEAARRVQRVFRGHEGKKIAHAIKSGLVIEKTFNDYLKWVNPYGDQVKEYWAKEKEDQWNAFMYENIDKAGNQLWEQKKDDGTGQFYYVNPETDETSWDPPPFGAPFKPYMPPKPSLAKAKLKRAILNIAAQNHHERLEGLKVQQLVSGADLGTIVLAKVKQQEYKEILKRQEQQQQEEWDAWDDWMRKQWQAAPTPWYEVPDAGLASNMYYINKNTGEVIWTPPAGGVFYLPFRSPSPEEKLPDLTLQLMKSVEKEMIKREQMKAYEIAMADFEQAKENARDWRKEAEDAEENAEAWQTERGNWSKGKDEDGSVYYWNTKTDETLYEEPEAMHNCQAALEYTQNVKTKAIVEEAEVVEAGVRAIAAAAVIKKKDEHLVKEVDNLRTRSKMMKARWEASQSKSNAEDQEEEYDRLKAHSKDLMTQCEDNWVAYMEKFEEKLDEDGEKMWTELKTRAVRFGKPIELQRAEKSDVVYKETLELIKDQEVISKEARVRAQELHLVYINMLRTAEEAGVLNKDEIQELRSLIALMEAEKAEEEAKKKEAELQEIKNQAKEAEENAKEIEIAAKNLEEEASYWESRQDKFGRTYYFNTKTEESRWDAPEVLEEAAKAKEQVLQNAAESQAKQEMLERVNKAAEEARKAQRLLEVKAIASLSATDARRKWTLAKTSIETAKAKIVELTEKVKLAQGKSSRLQKAENEARVIVEAARREADGWELHIDPRTGRSYYFNIKTSESRFDTPEMMKKVNAKETNFENAAEDFRLAKESATDLEVQLQYAEREYEEAVALSKLIMKAAIAAAQREASMPPPPPRKKPSYLDKVQKRAKFGAICSVCKEKKPTRRCLPCKQPFCLMCFNKSHAFAPKNRHAFVPIGRGLGIVGAGSLRNAKKIRTSGVHCIKCDTKRASHELYTQVKLPSIMEHYCPECFKSTTKCSACEKNTATRLCLSCNDPYCLQCFEAYHAKGKKKLHRWSAKPTFYRWAGFPVPAPLCCECWTPEKQERAVITCEGCGGDSFCYNCFKKIHRSDARKLHKHRHLQTEECDAPPKPFIESVAGALGIVKRDKYDEFGRRIHGDVNDDQLRESPPVAEINKNHANSTFKKYDFKESQVLLRLNFPDFTGGAHVERVQIVYRVKPIDMSRIDETKAYANNFEDLLETAKKEAQNDFEDLKKAQNKVEQRKMAISMGSRLKDKASAIMAAKKRLQESKESLKIMKAKHKRSQKAYDILIASAFKPLWEGDSSAIGLIGMSDGVTYEFKVCAVTSKTISPYSEILEYRHEHTAMTKESPIDHPDFIGYPENEPRCLECKRPATWVCKQCGGDYYCAEDCWEKFHKKGQKEKHRRYAVEGAEEQIDAFLIEKEQLKRENAKKMTPDEIAELKRQRQIKRDQQKALLKQRQMERAKKDNDRKKSVAQRNAHKNASASKIQAQWKAFSIRSMLGIGRKNRVQIWIGIGEFKSRNDEELGVSPGDLFWLDTKIYDPFVDSCGKVHGWFKATSFKDEGGGDLPVLEWRVVPSHVVRKTSRTERAQAIAGCIPKWTKI